FGLGEPFWPFTKIEFGYDDPVPTLRSLLTRLFVTDFAHFAGQKFPQRLGISVCPVIGGLTQASASRSSMRRSESQIGCVVTPRMPASAVFFAQPALCGRQLGCGFLQ